MFARMSLFTGNNSFDDLRKTVDNTDAVLGDAFSVGQLQSKRWLIDSLEDCVDELGTVFLCAGWYATLASMLFDSSLWIRCIRSFDIDPSCATIAETVNRRWVTVGWNFKATTADILDLEFDNYTYNTQRSNGSSVELCETADTIINTSCEHIPNFTQWYSKIPKGKLVVVQSNNYSELPEHVNTSNSLAEFVDSVPLTKTYYTGELELSKYTRYMVIGIR